MSKETKQARKTEIQHFKAMEKAIRKNDVEGFMEAADKAAISGVDLEKGKNSKDLSLGDIVGRNKKISTEMQSTIDAVVHSFGKTKEKVTEALEDVKQGADNPLRNQGLNRVTQVIQHAQQKHGVELTKDEIKDLATNNVDFQKTFHQHGLGDDLKQEDLAKRTDLYAQSKHAQAAAKDMIAEAVREQFPAEKLQGMSGRGRKEFRQELTDQIYKKFNEEGKTFDLANGKKIASKELEKVVKNVSENILAEEKLGKDAKDKDVVLYKNEDDRVHRPVDWKKNLGEQVGTSFAEEVHGAGRAAKANNAELDNVLREIEQKQTEQKQVDRKDGLQLVSDIDKQLATLKAEAELDDTIKEFSRGGRRGDKKVEEPTTPPPAKDQNNPALAEAEREMDELLKSVAPKNREQQPAVAAPADEQKQDKPARQERPLERSSSEEELPPAGSRGNRKPEIPELAPQEQKAAEPANPERKDTKVSDLQALQDAIGLNDPETLKADLRAPAARSKPVPDKDEQKEQGQPAKQSALWRPDQPKFLASVKKPDETDILIDSIINAPNAEKAPPRQPQPTRPEEYNKLKENKGLDPNLIETLDKEMGKVDGPPSKAAPMRPREEAKQSEPVPPSRPAPTQEEYKKNQRNQRTEKAFELFTEAQATSMNPQPKAEQPEPAPDQQQQAKRTVRFPDEATNPQAREQNQKVPEQFNLGSTGNDELKEAVSKLSKSGADKAEHVGKEEKLGKETTPVTKEAEEKKQGKGGI